MKKILTLVASVLFGFNANAQTVELLNLPSTPADAEAAGYGQMWNTWDWGALVPANTVLYDGTDVKLTLVSDAFLGYPGSKAGKNDYGFALCMSSTLGNFVADPLSVLDPAAVANTSGGKQGGVIILEPTVDGRVTLAYSSGFNNRSMFVFDVTDGLNEGLGATILANNIEQGADKGDQMKANGVKDKVHTPTFDVVAGHKYYIVGSGAQQELYSVTFTSFMNDLYKPEVASADNYDALLLDLPSSPAEAEAAGYAQMWNTWDWGAAVPANTVLYDGTDVKVTLVSEAFLGYPGSKAGKNDYGFALCMSSTLGNFVADPLSVLDPAAVANTSGGKQGGVVTLEPNFDGKVTLFYSTGFNNRSMFVFDVTDGLNEGLGATILANNIEQGSDKGDQMKADGVTDKVHTPTFDVVAGHKYYIVGSGSQQELYQIGWTSFMTDNYKPTGIENITTNVNKVQDGAIYTLQGVRVSKPVKGINIINGKKVIVK